MTIRMTGRWRISGPVVTLLLALLIHVVGMLLIKGFGTTFGIRAMLVLASQNSFEVMCAIEDGTVEAPEEIFFS